MLMLWIFITVMLIVALVFVAIPLLKGRCYKTFTVVLIIFVGLSLLAYWRIGASKLLKQYYHQQTVNREVKHELKHYKTPQSVIRALQADLRRNPNSAQGWYLLGKIYLGMNQYAKAKSPLQRAHQLKPTNAQYTVAYVEAAFFANGRKLTNQQQNLLLMLTKSVPAKNSTYKQLTNYVNALNLLGVNAYVQKDYRQAIKYWEKLLPVFPAGSQAKKALLKGLGEANTKLVNGVKAAN